MLDDIKTCFCQYFVCIDERLTVHQGMGEKEKSTAACLTRKSQSSTLAAGYQGAKLQPRCLTLVLLSAPWSRGWRDGAWWNCRGQAGQGARGWKGDWENGRVPGAQRPPQRSKRGDHLPLCWFQSLSGNVRKKVYSSSHVMLKLHRRGAGGGLRNLRNRVLPRTVLPAPLFPRVGLKKKQSFIGIFVGYNFLTSRLLKISMSQATLLPSN